MAVVTTSTMNAILFCIIVAVAAQRVVYTTNLKPHIDLQESLAVAHNTAVARKCGFDTVVREIRDAELVYNIAGHFNKILILIQLAEVYDVVIWIDTDARIMQPDEFCKLPALAPSHPIVMMRECNHINTGVIILHSNAWLRALFLPTWWDLSRRYPVGYYYDQRTMYLAFYNKTLFPEFVDTCSLKDARTRPGVAQLDVNTCSMRLFAQQSKSLFLVDPDHSPIRFNQWYFISPDQFPCKNTLFKYGDIIVHTKYLSAFLHPRF